MSNDAPLELFQFRFSMYPEKARWALDYKAVPHVRRSLVAGMHFRTMRRLSGQTGTPVIRHGDEVIVGSANCIDYVEQLCPEPTLYPAEPGLKHRALELQQYFDDIGEHVRRPYFDALLRTGGYASSLFTTGANLMVRAMYRVGFPVIQNVVRKENGCSEEGIAEGLVKTQEALDLIAETKGSEGYLVGDSFTVADLTAAVVLHPICLPKEYPVAIRRPFPSVLQQWIDRWKDHPGTDWVRQMYAKHRGTSAAVEA